MAIHVEFVAFGVTPEIVVIVENEDAALCLGMRPVKVRGGETADASPDDDEVVFLPGIRRGGPALAVAQCMSVLEGAGMIAAQAGEQRRVVAEGILGRGGQLGGARPGGGGVRRCSEQGTGSGCGGADGD